MKKKIPIPARLVVSMYQKHMGHVDRVDKNVSLSRMRLKRCMKRYHRAILLWYMGIVLNNIIVLFDLLYSDVLDLRKAKARISYKHWMQNELGNVLIEYGIRRTKETLAESFTARTSSTTTPSDSTTTQEPTPTVDVTVATPVLRDQTNATGGNSGRRRSGRPFKKKRRGGRLPASKKVHFTHSHTHHITHHPQPGSISSCIEVVR